MPRVKQAQPVAPSPKAAPAVEGAPVPRRLRPQAVGGLLRHALGPLTTKQGVQLAHILPFWPSICPLLHEHGVPESLRGGELTIAAATSSAQREFQFLAPCIIEGANRVLGYAGVSKIRSVVRSGALQPKTTAALSAPLPASPEAVEKAIKSCQSVKDEGLREALVRLGTRALVR